MAVHGEVDQGRGDVDGIDPLVGHRADVARSHVAEHPELALARAHRHELGGPGDLGTGARVDAGPSVQGEQGRSSQDEQPQSQGERQRTGGERPGQGPDLLDLLVAGQGAGREADLDLDELARTARTVPEGGLLRVVGARRGVLARHLGVR